MSLVKQYRGRNFPLNLTDMRIKSIIKIVDKNHQKSQLHQISPTSFPSSLSRRSFHLLQIPSRALHSGDQGDYSCSSEGCQKHQKLAHSHPFQILLPNPRTLFHKSSFIPRTCNLWNTLPLPFMNPTTCPISNLRLINLILSPSPLNLSSFLPLLGLYRGRHDLSSI